MVSSQDQQDSNISHSLQFCFTVLQRLNSWWMQLKEWGFPSSTQPLLIEQRFHSRCNMLRLLDPCPSHSSHLVHQAEAQFKVRRPETTDSTQQATNKTGMPVQEKQHTWLVLSLGAKVQRFCLRAESINKRDLKHFPEELILFQSMRKFKPKGIFEIKWDFDGKL